MKTLTELSLEVLPQTTIVDAAFNEWWNAREKQVNVYDAFLAGYTAALKQVEQFRAAHSAGATREGD